MKVVSIRCPECNAVTKVSSDKKYCYCPYCGTMCLVDDGSKRVEVNKNINIDKKSSFKREDYDYARIKEAEIQGKLAEEESRRDGCSFK